MSYGRGFIRRALQWWQDQPAAPVEEPPTPAVALTQEDLSTPVVETEPLTGLQSSDNDAEDSSHGQPCYSKSVMASPARTRQAAKAKIHAAFAHSVAVGMSPTSAAVKALHEVVARSASQPAAVPSVPSEDEDLVTPQQQGQPPHPEQEELPRDPQQDEGTLSVQHDDEMSPAPPQQEEQPLALLKGEDVIEPVPMQQDPGLQPLPQVQAQQEELMPTQQELEPVPVPVPDEKEPWQKEQQEGAASYEEECSLTHPRQQEEEREFVQQQDSSPLDLPIPEEREQVSVEPHTPPQQQQQEEVCEEPQQEELLKEELQQIVQERQEEQVSPLQEVHSKSMHVEGEWTLTEQTDHSNVCTDSLPQPSPMLEEVQDPALLQQEQPPVATRQEQEPVLVQEEPVLVQEEPVGSFPSPQDEHRVELQQIELTPSLQQQQRSPEEEAQTLPKKEGNSKSLLHPLEELKSVQQLESMHTDSPRQEQRQEKGKQQRTRHDEQGRAVDPHEAPLPEEEAPEPPTARKGSSKKAKRKAVQAKKPQLDDGPTAEEAEPLVPVIAEASRPRRLSIPRLEHWRNERRVFERLPGSLAPGVTHVANFASEPAPAPASEGKKMKAKAKGKAKATKSKSGSPQEPLPISEPASQKLESATKRKKPATPQARLADELQSKRHHSDAGSGSKDSGAHILEGQQSKERLKPRDGQKAKEGQKQEKECSQREEGPKQHHQRDTEVHDQEAAAETGGTQSAASKRKAPVQKGQRKKEAEAAKKEASQPEASRKGEAKASKKKKEALSKPAAVGDECAGGSKRKVSTIADAQPEAKPTGVSKRRKTESAVENVVPKGTQQSMGSQDTSGKQKAPVASASSSGKRPPQSERKALEPLAPSLMAAIEAAKALPKAPATTRRGAVAKRK